MFELDLSKLTPDVAWSMVVAGSVYAAVGAVVLLAGRLGWRHLARPGVSAGLSLLCWACWSAWRREPTAAEQEWARTGEDALRRLAASLWDHRPGRVGGLKEHVQAGPYRVFVASGAVHAGDRDVTAKLPPALRRQIHARARAAAAWAREEADRHAARQARRAEPDEAGLRLVEPEAPDVEADCDEGGAAEADREPHLAAAGTQDWQGPRATLRARDGTVFSVATLALLLDHHGDATLLRLYPCLRPEDLDAVRAWQAQFDR